MPLLQPTIPHTADGLLHLYRLVALQHAIQQGAIFPRWLPDLAYGYGFPLFIFYTPLSYYLTLIARLVSPNLLIAFNLSFALALFVASGGMYLFAKDKFGPPAGLLAAIAYVYAPFQLLNIHFRGGLPAAWALALFPFVFWVFGRLIKSAAPANQNDHLPQPQLLNPGLIAISALILGASLLMHNTLSLLFVPLFGLYLTIELGVARCRRGLLNVGLALLLGLGLAAFFLIPAVLEKNFAQVQRVITSPDFDFRYHFVSLAQLFSLPQPANTGLLNPNFPRALGLAQVGLATLGLLGLSLQIIKNRARPPAPNSEPVASPLPSLIFTTTSLTIAIFMMLPFSLLVWEQLPLLAFAQFPHRLLGPVALALALLAGAAAATLPQRVAFGLTLAGIGLIFLASIPLLYPRYRTELPANPSLTDMMAYEHASGAIGATSFGEYLPVWVQQIPRESPLEPMYRAGAPIERLDLAYLPPNAQLQSARYGFNRAEVVINSPQPFQAIFHTFYFPGWRAKINGQPAPIAPATERGLIGVSAPAGQHRLELYFAETPLRRVANGISAAALVIVAVLLGTHVARGAYFAKKIPAYYALRPTPYFNRRQMLTLAAFSLLLIAAKTLYFDYFDNPLKRQFDGADVAGAEVSTRVNFGGQVNLLGYSLNRRQVVAGQTFELTLFWQARQPLNVTYSALAQLVDDGQHLYAGQDNLHPGALPTTLWQPWGFAQDPHQITVPPGTPPGNYFLAAGLYQPDTWQRLPVLSGGQPGWSDVWAIPVTVTQPARQPTLAELNIGWPVQANVGPSLRLLGATPEREQIARGDFWRVALFWEAVTAPAVDYQIGLRLLAPNHTVALAETTPPSHGRYPTSRWRAGERVRDNHALWIPAGFPAGQYRVQARLLDEAGRPVSKWLTLNVITAE